jgi:hypothetical protein
MFTALLAAVFFGTLGISFGLLAHPVRPVHPF